MARLRYGATCGGARRSAVKSAATCASDSPSSVLSSDSPHSFAASCGASAGRQSAFGSTARPLHARLTKETCVRFFYGEDWGGPGCGGWRTARADLQRRGDALLHQHHREHPGQRFQQRPLRRFLQPALQLTAASLSTPPRRRWRCRVRHLDRPGIHLGHRLPDLRRRSGCHSRTAPTRTTLTAPRQLVSSRTRTSDAVFAASCAASSRVSASMSASASSSSSFRRASMTLCTPPAQRPAKQPRARGRVHRRPLRPPGEPGGVHLGRVVRHAVARRRPSHGGRVAPRRVGTGHA